MSTITTPIPKELVAALREAGIGCNMWAKLAALPHVTPAYVHAHTRARKAGAGPYRNLQKRNTGFQIHCMRSGDPAPNFCEECRELDGYHKPNCRYRYISGKYANHIKY